MNLNKVLLIGRLGKDPEIKNFDNGGKLAVINMAVDDPYWDKNKNHWVSNPSWIRVVFSDKIADRAEEALSKGDEILVEGKLKTRQYESKGGEKKTIAEIKGTFKPNTTKNKSNKNNNPSVQASDSIENSQPEGDIKGGQNANQMDETDDLPF